MIGQSSGPGESGSECISRSKSDSLSKFKCALAKTLDLQGRASRLRPTKCVASRVAFAPHLLFIGRVFMWGKGFWEGVRVKGEGRKLNFS